MPVQAQKETWTLGPHASFLAEIPGLCSKNAVDIIEVLFTVYTSGISPIQVERETPFSMARLCPRYFFSPETDRESRRTTARSEPSSVRNETGNLK